MDYLQELFTQVVPPKVEYELTELGYSLKLVIDALRKWGEIYAKA